MQPFTTLTAIVAPLDNVNVDTDAIIPKQFLKKIERTGFGIHLFHEWRYLDDDGKENNPNFVLNHERYQGAKILLTRDNFGCGSSREHAPWALLDYGFRCIIAPSFADIFYNNCFNNGILPVILESAQVQQLFEVVDNTVGTELTVDLPNQTVQGPNGLSFSFQVDPFRKEGLVKGLDSIGWSLQFEDKIDQYETGHQTETPWVYA